MEKLTKICTKCNCEKELTEFSFRKDTNDYRKQCKQCVSNVSKQRYNETLENRKEYRLKNKDKIAKKKKQYYEANRDIFLEKRKKYCIDNKESVKQQKRNYYLKNQEVVKQKTKDYYRENIEEVKKKSKEYRDNNFEMLKEKKKQYNKNNIEAVKERHRKYMKTEKGKLIAKNMKHIRRTAEKNGDVTTEQLKELYKNTKVCYWCSCTLNHSNTNLDHYIPIAKGGSHTISNIVLACSNCNKSKSSKDPIVFANSIGKLL